MAETTVLFFLSLLAVSFLYLTYKFNDRIWGVVAGLLLMLLGLIVVSSGVQYDTGQTLNQTTTYTTVYLNTSNFNATGGFLGYSYANQTVPTGQTQTVTLTRNTAREWYTDGLGLLLVLVGLFVTVGSALAMTAPSLNKLKLGGRV